MTTNGEVMLFRTTPIRIKHYSTNKKEHPCRLCPNMIEAGDSIAIFFFQGREDPECWERAHRQCADYRAWLAPWEEPEPEPEPVQSTALVPYLVTVTKEAVGRKHYVKVNGATVCTESSYDRAEGVLRWLQANPQVAREASRLMEWVD